MDDMTIEKLKKIKAIVSDIDGVLTDGRTGFVPEPEVKFFNFRDGHWLKVAMRSGMRVGLISGRKCAANQVRAKELGLNFLYEDVKDKRAAFEDVLKKYDLSAEECLYVGDDLIDYPLIKRAGFGVAVADGVEELDEVADYRTKTPGGHGVMVELVRMLLKAQGKMDEAMERYRK
ncbi:MAG: HAD hydrolase family protein [Lentisphaeria bacterium]|nr:HAD hydrolase family protein [Lentisphaeria bacterium]